MISWRTTLVAHLGYPTESFKAPMIYNPWFKRKGINAVVVPMGSARTITRRFSVCCFASATSSARW